LFPIFAARLEFYFGKSEFKEDRYVPSPSGTVDCVVAGSVYCSLKNLRLDIFNTIVYTEGNEHDGSKWKQTIIELNNSVAFDYLLLNNNYGYLLYKDY